MGSNNNGVWFQSIVCITSRNRLPPRLGGVGLKAHLHQSPAHQQQQRQSQSHDRRRPPPLRLRFLPPLPPKWLALLRRFRRVLGPFVGLPFHVVLGDRDVGECGEVDADRVSWVADQFPGLDSAACAAFEIGDVGFVTLNAVALLCGNCALRFEVERVVERESVDLRTSGSDGFGSGPVLLLHLPLDRTTDRDYAGFRRPSKSFTQGLNVLPKIREVDGGGIYDVLHTLPLNVSEYILQALKPRIIFSAHSYEFSDYVHRDGTREITVPAMSWNSRDDPGFVIATFQKAGRAVFNTGQCSVSSIMEYLQIPRVKAE
ncbi:hypothetical protein Fmac_010902 [Flemingia macrophylla]|uniref:Uncharacterized protein n=1 Tax=Flemingia macrophylla TaxID=520843 RepID=A0ABD1MKW4_9FABA